MKLEELKELWEQWERQKYLKLEEEWRAARAPVLRALAEWGFAVEEGWIIETRDSRVLISHPEMPVQLALESNEKGDVGYHSIGTAGHSTSFAMWISVDSPVKLFEKLRNKQQETT